MQHRPTGDGGHNRDEQLGWAGGGRDLPHMELLPALRLLQVQLLPSEGEAEARLPQTQQEPAAAIRGLTPCSKHTN